MIGHYYESSINPVNYNGSTSHSQILDTPQLWGLVCWGFLSFSGRWLCTGLTWHHQYHWQHRTIFFSAEDYIYWVDSQLHTISRIKRDLTGRQTLITSKMFGIEGVAIDWIAGRLSSCRQEITGWIYCCSQGAVCPRNSLVPDGPCWGFTSIVFSVTAWDIFLGFFFSKKYVSFVHL